MAHTPRLSGFSHAFTAAPVPTRTAQAPEDDVAAFDRAAARIQPSWAHLIGPRSDGAPPSSLAGSRREGAVRQPADVAAEAFAAKRVNAAVRRRTARDDDSLAEFPRAVRGRRSAAFWLAVVALAALGVAWALSDEPGSKRETRATTPFRSSAQARASTSPASPFPSVGGTMPANSHAEQRAAITNERRATVDPRAAASAVEARAGAGGRNDVATPGSALTPSARAAGIPAAPSVQVEVRGLALGQNRAVAGAVAPGTSAVSAPAIARGASPASSFATAQGGASSAKPAMLARPMAAARNPKLGRPAAVSAGPGQGQGPAEATVLRLKAEAAQATAELTMQVEPVGQPMGELPQRQAVGSGSISANPYDDEH